MGTIDKCTYTLTCTKCGATEFSSVLDKGSSWSGSSWETGTEFFGFNTAWSGGGIDEPELQSASCKQCGIPATVSSKYSQ